jgi:hypothetical protein
MAPPTQPATLSVAQIEELSQHFSFFRHDVNNSVGLVGAAAELMRYSPEASKKWSATLIEQPARIAGKTREFILEAERLLGLRNVDEASWYRDLWPRHNAATAEPPAPVQLAPAAVKGMHAELINLHKELGTLAFSVSGVEALMISQPTPDAAIAAVEQLAKVTRRFNQLAAVFEKNFGIISAPHRLLTGVPAGPVTFSPDELLLFHRRLTNLERDIHEHIKPLLELAHIARTALDQLQTRAPQLAPHGPKISALIQEFGNEFDKQFGLARGNGGERR